MVTKNLVDFTAAWRIDISYDCPFSEFAVHVINRCDTIKTKTDHKPRVLLKNQLKPTANPKIETVTALGNITIKIWMSVVWVAMFPLSTDVWWAVLVRFFLVRWPHCIHSNLYRLVVSRQWHWHSGRTGSIHSLLLWMRSAQFKYISSCVTPLWYDLWYATHIWYKKIFVEPLLFRLPTLLNYIAKSSSVVAMHHMIWVDYNKRPWYAAYVGSTYDISSYNMAVEMAVWKTFAVSLNSALCWYDISFSIVTVCFYVDWVYAFLLFFYCILLPSTVINDDVDDDDDMLQSEWIWRLASGTSGIASWRLVRRYATICKWPSQVYLVAFITSCHYVLSVKKCLSLIWS